MNWFVFAIAAWLLFGLELGLAPALSPGMGTVRPGFIVPLIVFVALQAPPRTALWAGLTLGLGLDLVTPFARTDAGTATIIGPHALGCLIAAQLVLAARGMVIHRNPITMTVLSVFGAAVASAVLVAFMTARGFYPDDPVHWQATRQLGSRLLSAVYTGAAAFLLSFPLFGLAGLFGFPTQGFGGGGAGFTWAHGGRR